MLRTLFQRTLFALIAATAAIGCSDTSSPNASKGVSETLQQPTFIGSSVGVAESSSYRISFVMGAQTPHREGEQYKVGNAQGDGQ